MSLLNCLSPIKIKNNNIKFNKKMLIASSNKSARDYSSEDNVSYMLVPCRKCCNCLQQSANEKAMRIVDELEDYKYENLCDYDKKELEFFTNFYSFNFKLHHPYQALFFTLTYRNDSISDNYSLARNDVIKFKKRLRRRLNIYYKNELKALAKKNAFYKKIYDDKIECKKYISYRTSRVKFIECGEYGETYHRPHYHFLVFGLNYNINTARMISQSWKYGKSQVEAIRSSKLISKYVLKVAKYVVKQNKLHKFHDKNIDILRTNKEPAYVQFSRHLGKNYCLSHAEALYTQLERHRYKERNIFNRHFPIEYLHYTEPIPRQYCIWLQQSSNKYIDIFDKRREQYKQRFNNEIERKYRQYNLTLDDKLNKNNDDFYDISNHSKLFNILNDYNHIHRFRDKEILKEIKDCNKNLRSQVNDISMSSPDVTIIDKLPPNRYLEHFTSEKYVCFWSAHSSEKSVAKDFSFYAYNLIQSKSRYKKYFNQDVFDVDKYLASLNEINNKIDTYCKKVFNLNSGEASIYYSNYRDFIFNKDNTDYDNLYSEYKDKVLKLVYKKEVQYCFDLNNIDTLNTDDFVYKINDDCSKIFDDKVLTFS